MNKQQFLERVNNYTKYKITEMLIEKHKDCKLDNLNKVEEVTDDVLRTLAICGLKFYGKMKKK
tara:strand:+ start:227 stop:415 length:189 start_codon:yes stop_codon:yes gene_type:complete